MYENKSIQLYTLQLILLSLLSVLQLAIPWMP